MQRVFLAVSNSGAFAAILAGCLLPGCASPQLGDHTACQQDKQALLATIQQQRDEVNALRDKTASLERRLAESETEIARIDPTRQARIPDKSQPSEGLSWRAPSETPAENNDASTRR